MRELPQVFGDVEVNGLVRQKGKSGTAYLDFKKTVHLLEQEYGEG